MFSTVVLFISLYLLQFGLAAAALTAKLSFAFPCWIVQLGLVGMQIYELEKSAKPPQTRTLYVRRNPKQASAWMATAAFASLFVICLALLVLGANHWISLQPMSLLRAVGIVVPLAVSLGHLAFTVGRKHQRNRPVHLAVKLVREGRQQDAISKFRGLLDDPLVGSPVATFLAVLLVRQRKFADAYHVIEEYLDDSGEQGRLGKLMWRSRLAREVGKPDVSLNAISEMVSNFGDLLVPRLHQIRWLRETGDLDLAASRIEQTLADFEAGTLIANVSDRDELLRWIEMDTAAADKKVWDELYGKDANAKPLGW